MPDSAVTTTPAPATAPAASPDLSTWEGREAHMQASLDAALKVAPLPKENDILKEPEPAAKAPEPVKDEKTPAPEKVEAKEPEKAPEPAKDEKGTIGKARRLFEEGDVDGALKLALGVDVNELGEAQLKSKHFKALVSREKEAAQKVHAAQAEVEKTKQEHQTQVTQMRSAAQALVPLIQAVQAYQKGDYEQFTRLATGDTLEGFQRKVLESLKQGAPVRVQNDPVLVARLEALERARVAEQHKANAERAKAEELEKENKRLQDAQNESKWAGEIAQELTDSGDARFVAMATNPGFLEHVIDVQRSRWNPKTQMTLDAVEAADEVWEKYYKGLSVPTPAPGAKTGAVTGRGGKDGAGGAQRTTNLNPSQAAEAAPDLVALPWSRDNQEKILETFVRKARSEAAA